MEFNPSVVGGKTPRNSTVMSIAFAFQSGNTLAQDLHAFNAPRQAASCKESDLDFGHVEPTAMLRGVTELDTPEDTPCLSRLEGFVECSRRVSIEVVLDDADGVSMRIDRINQPANAL